MEIVDIFDSIEKQCRKNKNKNKNMKIQEYRTLCIMEVVKIWKAAI